MPIHALEVAFDRGDGPVTAQNAIIPHGFGLRRAHKVDILRLLRAQGQLTLEAAIEGYLHLADTLRTLPSQLDPCRHGRRPLMEDDRVAVLIGNVARETIEDHGRFGGL